MREPLKQAFWGLVILVASQVLFLIIFALLFLVGIKPEWGAMIALASMVPFLVIAHYRLAFGRYPWKRGE